MSKTPHSARIKDILSKEEIQQFTEKSDWQGFIAIANTWLCVAACFALLAWLPNPLSFLFVVIILGGQQLRLAIINHEAAHRTLFKTRWLNDAPADWLGGRPIWLDVARYRAHHIKHHSHTGTDEDPDLNLVTPFPTTRSSLRRKLIRDLSGLSGLKRMLGLFLMDVGILQYHVAGDAIAMPKEGRRWWHYVADGLRNFGPVILSNLAIAALLAGFDLLWAYSAWVIAYLTTFSLFLRVRAIAEHACTEMSPDMFKNTRTTYAGWLARWTVAPLNVNYHLEHHLMASVPFFQLPKLHALLKERGYVEGCSGYDEVLRLAGNKMAA